MRKHQKEAILISYLKQKQRYKKFAEYIVNLIKDDPSFPKECLHTIIYRIKNEKRLIEKIDERNMAFGTTPDPITEKNFKTRIGDLIGIRFICLRLSDIGKVEGYLDLLADEKILRFITEPDKKRSFVLPTDPGVTVPENLDLRYGGYSSIHYQVELGEKSDAAAELQGIRAEFQLRTILEEAWGEIDHKYRYAISRSGIELPEHIHSGFYNLSAYLQVAAMQAEYLCRQADIHGASMVRVAKWRAAAEPDGEFVARDSEDDGTARNEPAPDIQELIEETFGFQITPRTLMYINKRFTEAWNMKQPQLRFRKIFTENKLREFRTIFRQIRHQEAFEDIQKRNIDVINAVNFVLFDEALGTKVAREGLKSVLKRRTP